MTGRENVIRFLQETAEYFRECRSNASFASKAEKHFWEMQNAANEVVELLKEQEAVEPIKMQRMDSNFSCFVPYYLCGNCRYELMGKDVMFCSHCGRAVKWNG